MTGTPPDDSDFDQRLDDAWQRRRTDEDPRVESALDVLYLIERVRNSGAAVAADSAGSAGPESPDALPCEIGRFRIRRLLGRGGNGVVFLAFDPSLNREVALKIPLLDGRLDPEQRARFFREAKAAASLNHTHVVPVFEVGRADTTVYIASACCRGPTLEQWRGGTDRIDVRVIARVTADLASALEHAHERGVVHRDLKPSNVLFEEDPATGERLTPQITDFGMARIESPEAELTRTGSILGTPEYMSPEQSRGQSRQLEPATDIYSLGAILYFLLTGRPPFVGADLLDILQQVRSRAPVSPGRVRRETPEDLQAICLKCLEKQPARRYAGARELHDDLIAFLNDRPVVARNPTLFERALRVCRRNPLTTTLITLVLLLTTTLAVAGSWGAFHFRALADDRARALHEKDTALTNKDIARQEADQQLYESLLNQLETLRWSRRQGHRVEALRIADAARTLQKKLGKSQDIVRLRTEVADVLTRIDLRAVDAAAPDISDSVCDYEVSDDGRWFFRVGPDGARVKQKRPPLPIQDRIEFVEPCGPLLSMNLADQSRVFFRSGTPRTFLRAVPLERDKVRSARDTTLWWTTSSDGSTVVAGSQSGHVAIWSPGTELDTPLRFQIQGTPTHYAADPQGKTLAVAMREDRKIRFYDTADGQLMGSTERMTHVPHHIDWSLDGRYFVHARSDRVVVREALSRGLVRSVRMPHGISELIMAPEGERLLVGLQDGTFRLLHWPTLTELLSGEDRPLRFDSSGRFLRTETGWFEIIGHPLLTTLPEIDSRDAMGVPAFSPDGRRLVTVARDEVRLWGIETGVLLDSANIAGARSAAFSGATEIVVGTPQGVVRLPLVGTEPTRFDSARSVFQIPAGTPPGTGALAACSATGTVLYHAGDQLIDLSNPATPILRDSSVGRVVISPDGNWFAVAGPQVRVGSRTLPDATTFTCGDTFHRQPVAFGPDSQRVFASVNGETRVLETGTAQTLFSLPAAEAIAVSARNLVALSDRKSIRVFDGRTGSPLIALHARTSQALIALAFDPSGDRLAGLFFTGEVRVWQIRELESALGELDLAW